MVVLRSVTESERQGKGRNISSVWVTLRLNYSRTSGRRLQRDEMETCLELSLLIEMYARLHGAFSTAKTFK